MRRDQRIGLHSRQRTAQIPRPFPIQDRARDGHRIPAVVAGVIDGDHDIAFARQSGAKPSHHPCRSAKPVRQQDHGPRLVIGERRFGSSLAWPKQGLVRRPHIERLFDGAGGGGIPDCNAQLIAVPGVAQGGRRFGRGEVTFADRESSSGIRQANADRSCEDQARHSLPLLEGRSSPRSTYCSYLWSARRGARRFENRGSGHGLRFGGL